MSLIQYWPMSIVKDNENAEPRIQHTYDSVLTMIQVQKVFDCWKNDFHYIFLATWIEMTVSEEKSILGFNTYSDTWKYLERIEIKPNNKISYIAKDFDSHWPRNFHKEESENVYTESH